MNEETRGSVSAFTIVLVGAIVLLLGYVLSPVPVLVLINHTGLSESDSVQSAIETVYLPLEWLCENVSLVEAFYDYQSDLLGQFGLST